MRKAFSEIDPNWERLDGLVVCGTHSKKIDMGLMLFKIREARENNIPFLGICSGLQMAAIEYARNVMNIIDATSEEYELTDKCVVKKLPELRVGVYKVGDRFESHWHSYYVSSKLLSLFSIPHIATGDIVEEFFLPRHKHFVAVQYHPEYQSSSDNPHPIIKKFLDVCKSHTAGHRALVS